MVKCWTFNLKLGKRQVCLFSSLLFHNILKHLPIVIIQEKEIEDMNIMARGRK